MAKVLSSSASHQRQGSKIFGHPRGLLFIAGTELWDRISFHGMQALLVLYMVDQLLLPGHVEHVVGFAPFRAAIQSVTGPAEQHHEERPRGGEHRTARIEDEKSAPQSAQRELRGEGQDGAPARPLLAVGHPLGQYMHNEHGDGRNGEIADEHGLRVGQIDPAEGVIVEDEAADHAGRRQRPLMPGNEGKSPLDHVAAEPSVSIG